MSLAIGILTMHWANNYGGLLQCYALCQYLKNEGYDARIVNYWPLYALQKRSNNIGKDAVISEFGDVAHRLKRRSIKNKLCAKPNKSKNIDLFRDSFLDLSEVITDERILKEELSKYDVLVVGSDQIWNPNITGGRFDDAYFLNFNIKGKKIAYAASTGIELPTKLLSRFYELIKDFQFVSAREISLSKNISKEGIEAPAVMDPVFLVESTKWDELVCSTANEDYILVYTLEKNKELVKTANWLQKYTKIPLIVIGSHSDYKNVKLYADDVSVNEFLGLIRNAKYVITNSFHGTAFSLIFEKEFIVFPHSEKPTRMIELLTRAGVEERIVYKCDDVVHRSTFSNSINYNSVKEKLNLHIRKSKDFLDKAINSESISRDIISERLCSGCTACISNCPKNAIELSCESGFYKARINRDKCINCGRCMDVCPHNHSNHNEIGKLYAFKHFNDEIRAKSSSGGFFSAIGQLVLNKKGIIYGVKYNTQKNAAEYQRCTSKVMLDECRQSKYIQADVGGAFANVCADLEQNRLVLFTGTPCVIQGLINYLDKRKICKDNLLTAEIVCHGTPSPLVFNDFIKYLVKKRHRTIEEFIFRDKSKGWRGHGYKTIFNKGKSSINDYYSMAWNKLFTLSINDVCFQCLFASPYRISDFTMGDFWGVEKSNCIQMDDNQGISLVLFNSDKSISLVPDLNDLGELKETELGYAAKNNPLFRPTFKVAKYDTFWADFYNQEFDYCMNQYCYFHGINKVINFEKWFILYFLDLKKYLLKQIS